MSDDLRNEPVKSRGGFQKGNPGRPRGARSKATLAAEALLDGEAQGLTRKAIEMGLAGDPVGLKLCLDRIIPPRRSRPVSLVLPPVDTAKGVTEAMAMVVAEMAEGNVSPDEAQTISGVLDAQRRAIETTEIEARLVAIEERLKANGERD